MTKIVNKKIIPEYFELVRKGIKNFELRKDEDDIQPNDILVLYEWDDEEYTGKYICRTVIYVLRDVP